MDVVSLGYRTDLALLELGGARIEDRGDHMVVRSPANPTFWWGNFILLEHAPAPDRTQSWLDVFHAAIPDARHVALGIDGSAGTREDLAGFANRGLTVFESAVMTAQAVHEPPHPNRQAEYRRLETDEDWAQLVDTRIATDDNFDPVEHRGFVEAKARVSRQTSQAGHGAWFGAFIDGRLRSSMGIVRADDELARFQDVGTRPDARGQGLAGTLVHYVSQYGLGELGATTLVMVADPDYLAIRIYRAVGFTMSETQLQVEKPNPGVCDEDPGATLGSA